jgi:hypothetical protein
MSTKGKAHTGGICILAAVLLVQSLGALPFAAASTPTPTTMDADTLRSLGMSTSEIESLLFEQAGGNEKEPGESILGYENDDDLGIDADENEDYDEYDEYDEYDHDDANVRVAQVFEDDDFQLDVEEVGNNLDDVDQEDENDQWWENPLDRVDSDNDSDNDAEDEYEYYDNDDDDEADEVEKIDDLSQVEAVAEQEPVDGSVNGLQPGDDLEDEYDEYDEYDDEYDDDHDDNHDDHDVGLDDIGGNVVNDEEKEETIATEENEDLSNVVNDEEKKETKSTEENEDLPTLPEPPSRSQALKTRSSQGVAAAASSALPVLLPKIGRTLIQSPVAVQIFALGTVGNFAIHRMGLMKKLKKRKGNAEGGDSAKDKNLGDDDSGDYGVNSYFEESDYMDLDEIDNNKGESGKSFEEIEDLASSFFDDDGHLDEDKKQKKKKTRRKKKGRDRQKEERDRQQRKKDLEKAEIEERKEQEKQRQKEEVDRKREEKQRQKEEMNLKKKKKEKQRQKKESKSKEKNGPKIWGAAEDSDGVESGAAFVQESKSQRKGIFGGNKESEMQVLIQKVDALTQRADAAEISRDQLEADCFSATNKVCLHHLTLDCPTCFCQHLTNAILHLATGYKK